MTKAAEVQCLIVATKLLPLVRGRINFFALLSSKIPAGMFHLIIRTECLPRETHFYLINASVG